MCSYTTGTAPEFAIKNSHHAATILRLSWKKIRDQERTYVLYLNKKDEPLAYERINIGNQYEVNLDFKETIRIAWKTQAHKIIVAHNHTNGNTEPSESDIRYCKILADKCGALDIVLQDFIIITERKHYSFRDKGYCLRCKKL